MTRTPGPPDTGRWDAITKQIVAILQQDGRTSYSSIGKQVGLSEAAVRARVQRLTESGAVQIVAVADPQEMGFARQAMIGIRASGPLEPLAQQLSELPEVIYVVITAGSFDLLIEVVCESDAHLLELVSGHLRGRDDVAGTETFLYLKTVKESYSWGIPG